MKECWKNMTKEANIAKKTNLLGSNRKLTRAVHSGTTTVF